MMTPSVHKLYRSRHYHNNITVKHFNVTLHGVIKDALGVLVEKLP